jgi:hypothetical protein
MNLGFKKTLIVSTVVIICGSVFMWFQTGSENRSTEIDEIALLMSANINGKTIAYNYRVSDGISVKLADNIFKTDGKKQSCALFPSHKEEHTDRIEYRYLVEGQQKTWSITRDQCDGNKDVESKVRVE